MKKLKVLLVDDEEEFVETLADRLKMRDLEASTAHNGEEALSVVKKEEPDVIVLDVRLPDGDGIHFCAELADDRQTAGIPVILVSGADDRDIVRKSRMAGCRFFVHKPFDPNALLVLVQNALSETTDWV